MEKINNTHDSLVKALKSVARSIDKYTNPSEHTDAEDTESYMTTLIKRFELTHECLWKFLKVALRAQAIKTSESKDVIRKSHEFDLLTLEESQVLLDAVEDRNTTAHIYDNDDGRMEKLCDKIIKYYYPVFKTIIERTNSLMTD